MKYVYRLVISIVVCQGAGLVGSIFTAPSIPTWYAALQKPPFTPPNWLFAPAWITLYLLMGISASLVWQNGLDNRRNRTALIVFLIQLVLNALWSIAFFGFESPLPGMVVIVLLWVAILITMLRFLQISKLAGFLLTPYLGWVTFAAILNVSIFILSP
jgi:tryptophan-rich sensory protein